MMLLCDASLRAVADSFTGNHGFPGLGGCRGEIASVSGYNNMMINFVFHFTFSTDDVQLCSLLPFPFFVTHV